LLPILSFPMVINQVVGISADGFSIAATILLLSVVNGFNSSSRLSVVSFYIATFLVLNAKPTYFPMIFLSLYMMYREESLRTLSSVAKMILVCSTAILLQYYFVTAKTPDLNHSVERIINSSAQLKFIVHNPIVYVQIIFSSWGGLLKTAVGDVGWLDTPISDSLENAFLVVLGLLLLTYAYVGNVVRSGYLFSISVLAIVVIPSVVLVFTSMYLYWTSVGALHVDGVQGRYLIPIFIIVAVLPILRARLVNGGGHAERLKLIVSFFALCFMGIDLLYIYTTIIPRFYL